jgi:hypothetical protein
MKFSPLVPILSDGAGPSPGHPVSSGSFQAVEVGSFHHGKPVGRESFPKRSWLSITARSQRDHGTAAKRSHSLEKQVSIAIYVEI